MRVGIIGAPQIQMQLINTLLNRDLLKTLATSLPSSDFSVRFITFSFISKRN